MIEGNDFELEWEERDESTPFSVHMLAGSVAGLSEHILLLPLDNIKTHMQTSSLSVRTAVAQIYRTGLSKFYSGSRIIFVGCVPSHAIYFLNYEFWKKKLNTEHQLSFFRNMAIGCTSALFHDAIMTPCDMLKQRIQLTNLGYATIIRETLRSEGLFSFWRSFPVNFFGSLPASMVTVTANENLKHLHRSLIGPLAFHSYFLCAGLAGAISATITAPLDNIRTRLNTQLFHINNPSKIKAKFSTCDGLVAKKHQNASINRAFSQQSKTAVDPCKCNPLSPEGQSLSPLKYPNTLCAVKIIYKEEGVRGFFKGVSPRIGYQVLSSGLSWSIYEFCKSRLLGASTNKK